MQTRRLASSFKGLNSSLV